MWRDHAVAYLAKGKTLTTPRLISDRAIDTLPEAERERIAARLDQWLKAELARRLSALSDMSRAATDPATPPRIRAVLAPIAANGGFVAREEVTTAVAALTTEDRAALRRAGLTIGQLDLFDVNLLKARALPLLSALLTAAGRTPPPLAPPGATVAADARLGFRPFGAQWVRIDVAEKILRALHERRNDPAFAPDPALATSMGVTPDAFAALLRAAGFRLAGQRWRYRPAKSPAPVTPAPGNRFAALAALGR